MKAKKALSAVLVICAGLCLSSNARAVDDPNDLPELFDQSRQQTCCSSFVVQETDGGTEIAE